MAYDATGSALVYDTEPVLVAGPDTRLIQLTRGFEALIDVADYPRVTAHSWRAHKARAKWYARTDVYGRAVYLHRLITNAEPGWVVDHLNQFGLDCRRDNLRVCGFDKNAQNASYANSSGFRGVTYERGRYRARIVSGGISGHLGLYNTPEDAALAYDKAAIEIFGEFAWTNFARDLRPGISYPVADTCDPPF